MTEHKHLKRLERIWIKNPVYFITTCIHKRQAILTNSQNAIILIDEWSNALKHHGWSIGRYVIMPDHVHFFCAPVNDISDYTNINSIQICTCKTLSIFIQQWKQWTSKRILRENYGSPDGPSGLQPPIWQKGFFDHLIRSPESFAPKWEYIRQNPVRAGLVDKPEDWLWKSEINQYKI